MSEVYYRRWRPQALSDVVGQEHVTRTLLNALKTGHVSHAYLFCGPRGTGKTSTSRILAKAVNCLTTDGTGEPCNTCSMCQAITEGRAMDVIEIDAASNTGVDDIRSLKEKVAYSPAEGRYKIYIVDEVHMLSNNASNALLKTLEEPPPRVIFILATTESHKLLPTILSRCQRFDFKRLKHTDIIAKLQSICQQEGLSIEPEALKLVARSATGSLRDAENLLEQLAGYYGSQVTVSQVTSLLGNAGSAYARTLLAQLVGGNTRAGLETINQAEAEGVDLKLFTREITTWLRGLLLVKSGINSSGDFTSEEIADLQELAPQITPGRLLKTIRLFGEVKIESSDTLPLEIALVEATLDTQPETPVAPRATDARPAKPAPARKPSSIPAPAQPSNTIEPRSEPAPAATPEEKTPEVKEKTPPVASDAPAALSSMSEFELIQNNWNQMLEQAPDATKRSAAIALMRSSMRLVSFDNDLLVLAFKYKIHKEKMEEAANSKVAVQIVSSYVGRPVKIECIHEPEKNHLVHAAQDKLNARITHVEEK
ncbi:MAG: DNA polymerase III subunit gamma/tau [Dehalococcoidaceae bacterium]|nr:DNA polymerase III subunit gamma/tau [Dehalococcoidaceae bacterium]